MGDGLSAGYELLSRAETMIREGTLPSNPANSNGSASQSTQSIRPYPSGVPATSAVGQSPRPLHPPTLVIRHDYAAKNAAQPKPMATAHAANVHANKSSKRTTPVHAPLLSVFRACRFPLASPFYKYQEVIAAGAIPLQQHAPLSLMIPFSIDGSFFQALRSGQWKLLLMLVWEDGTPIKWIQSMQVRLNNLTLTLPEIRMRLRPTACVVPEPIDITSRVNEYHNALMLGGTFGAIGSGRGRPCAIVVRSVSVPLLEMKPGKGMLTTPQEKTLNHDDEVGMVTERLSLKCPLSFTRIDHPVRGKLCRHRQCFDFATYLLQSRRTQIWNCPVCDRPLTYASLLTDPKFENYLSSVGASVEEVVVDGSTGMVKAASTVEASNICSNVNVEVEEDYEKEVRDNAAVQDIPGVSQPVLNAAPANVERNDGEAMPPSSVTEESAPPPPEGAEQLMLYLSQLEEQQSNSQNSAAIMSWLLANGETIPGGPSASRERGGRSVQDAIVIGDSDEDDV